MWIILWVTLCFFVLKLFNTPKGVKIVRQPTHLPKKRHLKRVK